MKSLFLIPIIVLVTDFSATAATYSTNFPLTENPIFEDGHWINGSVNGIDWSNARTTPGKAFGTQTGGGPNYADSTALLTGSWGPTQTATATVYISSPDSTQFEEVELRLRSTISPHSNTGYEINYSVKPNDPYCQVVRWNGPLGSFTLLDARPVGVSNGDVVKATITGSTITCYKNNVAIFSVTDSTFTGGSPGIGFFLQNGSGPPSNYGFSSFTASDGTTSPTPTVAPSVTPTPSATATAPPQITLTATVTRVDLVWSGATSNRVDIYRNGIKIATRNNVGAYTDNAGTLSAMYKVCNAGSSTCSDTVTVR